MKPVRGLRGSVGPASLDQARDPQDITSAEGINPAAGVAATQVPRVRRRDELFDDVDRPSDDVADEPIIFGRTADIGALIDRLVATSATQAAQTGPAVDVLRRLKRLMELTERRRNAARPVAGQGVGPLAGPPSGPSPSPPMTARDGMKRLPPPPRPDFAPSRDSDRDDRPVERAISAGLKTSRSDKDRPQ
jgi:hypothetical protein